MALVSGSLCWDFFGQSEVASDEGPVVVLRQTCYHPSFSKTSVPTRAEEEYEYAFDDEPTPSPQAYGGTPNPQTPGYPDPSSPQVNPQYNPQTPGTPAM